MINFNGASNRIRDSFVFFICGSIILFGSILSAGYWRTAYDIILKINPVSVLFEPVLASLIQNVGYISILVGLVFGFVYVILETKRRYIDILMVGVLTTIVFSFYSFIQPMTELNNHMAWDGTQYASMTHFFKTGVLLENIDAVKIPPSYPYSQRVLVPYLVSLIPSSTIMGFRIINGSFLVLAVISFFSFWTCSLQLSKSTALLGILFFLFHWVSPIRSLNYCVFSVDAPVYFFEIVMLWLIQSRRFYWLLPLSVIATLCKEQFAYIFLVFTLYAVISNYIGKQQKYPLFILAASTVLCLITSAIAMRIPFSGHGFGGFTVVFFLWRKLCEPLGNIRWIVSVCTAYGAMIFLLLIGSLKFEKRQIEVMILSCLFLVFSYCGATDMTRTAFLGFPFVATLVLMSISKLKPISIVLSIILSIPIMRLVQEIPDVFKPLPCNDITGFYSWMPEYADMSLVIGWCCYFIVCYLILFVVEGKRNEKS